MPVNISAETFHDSGRWLDYCGSKFLVRSTSTSAYQRMLSKLHRPYRRQIDNGTIDPDVARKIIAKTAAKTLLIDWSDVVDANNGDVPFDVNTAETVLNNQHGLRDAIMEFADEVANFESDQISSEENV